MSFEKIQSIQLNNRENAFISIQNNISQLIQSKVFLGRYTERRYVESLQEYRDIIVVESNEDIFVNLMQTKKKLEDFDTKKWIGISDDPQNIDSGDCLLWVHLNNVPIGKHWFQMSAVRFEELEIILEIQYVQPYRSPDRSFNISDPDFPNFDLKEILTYKNMCEVIKFSAIVFMTIITFAIEALKYLGEYSIMLSHIIVNLVHVSTPICIGMFEFFAKCVGGFYWLIYVLIRGSPDTPVVPSALLNNQRQLGSYRNYRQIKYTSNSPDRKDWSTYQRRY